MATRRLSRPHLRLAALCLCALVPVGCGGDVRQAAASESRPAPVAPAAAPAPSAPSVPPAPEAPPPVRVTEAETLRGELEALDRQVQEALTALSEALKDFESERRGWAAADRSMAAARKMNAAIGARNKTVVGLYDARVEGVLGRFREKLQEAPAAYHKLATERRALYAAATLDLERRSYLGMAEFCEAAAAVCERRHAELFTAPSATRARPNAVTLAETMAGMRRLSVVHDRWEETFAAYPTSLDDSRLATLFDHLSAYAEDLGAFTRGVESLKDALRQKGDAGPRPDATPGGPAAPKQRPELQASAELPALPPARAGSGRAGEAAKLMAATPVARGR